MRMNAVLSNPKHPEYGQYTVPLPIPSDQYDGIMEALNTMGMGDPLARDCQMDEIFGEYPILKRLEGKSVNIDELDYLAKRLDSFCCALEGAQFQGAAVSYDYSDMTDLINLTFSCQQITVITDFSDLEQVGREHYMVLNGGCASKEELDNLDGYETALLLIDEGDGVVTPYGVVYDNGMCLSQVYDGRHFPQYFYEPPLLTLTLQESKGAPQTWLYLPAPDLQIKRSLVRAGIVDPADMELSFQASEFPDAVDCVLDTAPQGLSNVFYAAYGNTGKVHLNEGLLHAAFPPTVPLNNSRLKGDPFEFGYLESDIPGSGSEIAVVMTAAVALALLVTLVPGSLGQLLRLSLQKLVECFLYAAAYKFLELTLDYFFV